MKVNLRAGRLGLIAAALALGLAACGGGSGSGGGLADLQIGDCIKFVEVSETADDAATVGYEQVDCDKAGEFKLVVTSINPADGCANEEYVNYGSEDHSVCVAPVLEVGSCYAPDDVAEWVVSDCTAEETYFKVEKELSGVDTAECTDADGHFILPEPDPGKVYCTIAPN